MLLKYSLSILRIGVGGGASRCAAKLIWKERAPIPLPRSGFMAGAINGKYVVAGGSFWVGKQKHWSSEVDAFDPVSNTWTKEAPLSEPRSDAASVVYDGVLYFFGGNVNGHARRDAWAFRNHKWSLVQGAELPEPRVYAAAVACKGLIYMVGGLSGTDERVEMSNALWVWDPREPQKRWDVAASMPGPGLMAHAVAMVDGKVYVLGGAKKEGKGVANVKTVFEFNPAIGKWTQLGDLPIGRRCWWGMGVDSKILLIGGYTTTYERDVFTYHLPSGGFVNSGLIPHGICAAKFVRVGGSIIGTGGEAGEGIRGKWTFEARLAGN